MSLERPMNSVENSEGFSRLTDKKIEGTNERLDSLQGRNLELEADRKEFAAAIEDVLNSFDKKLDLSEAKGIMEKTNSPEILNDIGEARKLQSEIRGKLFDMKKLFRFDTSR